MSRGANAAEALKRTGKIRYYGIACDSIDQGSRRSATREFRRYNSLSAYSSRAASTLFCKRRAAEWPSLQILGNGLLVKEASQLELGKYCSSGGSRASSPATPGAAKERPSVASRWLAWRSNLQVAPRVSRWRWSGRGPPNNSGSCSISTRRDRNRNQAKFCRNRRAPSRLEERTEEVGCGTLFPSSPIRSM